MVLLCKLGWPGPHGAQLTPASCAGTEGVLPHQAPTVLLVCIFLKTSNVESLFMCITIISICHLWRNAHVRDQIVLLSSYRHPICALCDWQLSHPSPCLPHSPASCATHRSHLSSFAVIGCAFAVQFEKPQPRHSDVMLSLYTLQVISYVQGITLNRMYVSSYCMFSSMSMSVHWAAHMWYSTYVEVRRQLTGSVPSGWTWNDNWQAWWQTLFPTKPPQPPLCCAIL